MIKNDIIECFIDGLSSTVREKEAVYVSTPITTGPLLIEKVELDSSLLQLSSKSYSAYLRQHVIPQNVEKAKSFVDGLRGARNEVVIDPSLFFSEQFDQDDYLFLWERVIKRFAKSVFFNLGWEYSNGCVTEYCIAQESGLATFDHEGAEIPLLMAIDQVEQAIAELNSVDLPVAILEAQIHRLKNIVNNS